MSNTEELTIMMAGSAACRAALDLLSKEHDELKARYSARYLENAGEKLKNGILSNTALEQLIEVLSPKSFVLCGKKGVFSALYELGETVGCGLKVQLYSIPIEQPTIELCDLKDINPYESDSTGSVVFAVENPGAVAQTAEKLGIKLHLLGYSTKQKAKIVVSETERYLTR
jgi:hydrogenase maturation factor